VSFEVYVQCFQRGQPGGVPRAAVRPLFPVVEAESGPDYWSVRYDDRNSCRVGITPLESDPALVEALCVYRPCGDPRLWESLLAVMRLGPVALYFPGDSPPLVAGEASGEHLPADMVAALGSPRVVRSGQEIVEIIRRS
jgi:hypothetical protein